MSNEHYCLRWNNHQPNFIAAFSNLLCNETLVDITLAAEGKYIQAHKVVLSACSSYFQLLFTSNPCQHPIVILKDVKYNDLKIVVEFMYLGEVNVSQDQLSGVLKTAETLQVKGLADMPDYMIYDKPKNVTNSIPNSVKRKKFRKSSTESGSESIIGGSSSTEEVEVLGPVHLDHLSAETHENKKDTKNSDLSDGSRNDISKELNSRLLPHQKSDGWTLLEQLSARSASMLGSHNTSPCSSDQLFPLTSSSFLDQQQPKVRKRNVCRDDENFERALEDVREGRLGFCKAARMYGINNRTLWLEFKKRGYQSTKAPSPDKNKQQTPSSSTVDLYHPPDVTSLPPPPPPPAAAAAAPESPLVQNDQFNQYSSSTQQPTTPPTAHYSSPYTSSYFAAVPSIHPLQPIQPNP